MNRNNEVVPSSTMTTNDRQFTIEDKVLKGRVISYDDEHTSLGEFVLRKLKDKPDFVGQIDAVTGEEYTYQKMRERSVRCALWMQSHGLRPRDVVAVYSENQLDCVMPCFAALYLGAVCCFCDILGGAEELDNRMNLTKPKVVFVTERAVPLLLQVLETGGHNVKIIVFGRVPGLLDFESIIAEPSIEEVEKFVSAPIQSSGEIAFIFFSSGTTGLPKAVSLSHRGVTMLTHQAEALGMNGNICMAFGYIDWINMLESIMMTLLLDIPRIILPPYEEHSACALIEKYKANWVHFYPTMIHRLLASNATGGYDLSSLTKIVFTGGPLADIHRRALGALLPKARITSAYGSTESCGYISMGSASSRPGACGVITENAQVKVIDLDTARTLGVNQKGELLLKFACMMNCYYNNPEATAEVIDEDGWLHSGDIGYFDEGGEIFLVDRIGDIIRCGDDPDITPPEIEEVILSHPGVKEVAVVGKPNPGGFESPIAFVVRAEDFSDTNKQVTETEIISLVAAALPDSRHLRGGVRFIDHIPRTRTNKIRRSVLRDLARSV